ncbi:lysozyme-like domain-containing protein [Russula compacta]|nr:lysozyme-like domain-containing protein [Russula compacta]
MKLSIGFATLSLLLAAAAVEVEASSSHDAAHHKHHAARGHSCDPTYPGRHCHSDHIARKTAFSAKLAQSSSQNPPSNYQAYSPQVGGSGTIQLAHAGKCNPTGATAKVTTLSGPNGHIDWLNCGINDYGWSPAPVKVDELVVVSLDSARHTTFSPCSDQILATLKKYGQKLGIPPIILASFAMQESSCNPSAIGGAGEQGLMQITPDKCKGAPNGNCKDIDFNIRVGAEFFVSVLASNGGNVFLTIGEYNGWRPGMTYDDATRAAHTCCRCQNNLD